MASKVEDEFESRSENKGRKLRQRPRQRLIYQHQPQQQGRQREVVQHEHHGQLQQHERREEVQHALFRNLGFMVKLIV